MLTRCLAALCAATLCIAFTPAASRADNAAEGQSPGSGVQPATGNASDTAEEQFLDLVSAYQSSYLQVVAVSAYQLYAGAGLVEGAFRSKQIDGPSALDVLGQNSLLHSVCYTTLVQVQKLTPPDDDAALGEIGRLGTILETENQLLIALSDLFGDPSDANSKAVDDARTQVEAVLQKYADAGEGPGAPAGK